MGGEKKKTKSICFISRYAHFLLLGKSNERVGGAEFQQCVLAKALVDLGWRVVFVTEKFTEGRIQLENGIVILPCLDFSRKVLFPKRFTLCLQLWQGLKQAGCHIYYQRNPGIFSAIIGEYCRIHGRKFIIAGAHDTNFDVGHELNVNSFVDRFELKMGFKLANTIIVQNLRQQQMLAQNYRRKGVIFNNLYDGDGLLSPDIEVQANNKRHKTRKKIIWVGRLITYKQPQLCVALARLLPEYDFLIVGAKIKRKKLFVDVAALSQGCKNISFLGHLALEETERVFDIADALVNTSSGEGFPNTFLQAWSRGLPVFTFLDPNNFITEYNLGKQVDSIEEMAMAIRDFFAGDVVTSKRKIREFFLVNFSVKRKITEFEKILLGPEEEH